MTRGLRTLAKTYQPIRLPSSQLSESIRTMSIVTRRNARHKMSPEFSVFEDFREVRGRFSKRYACNRSNRMRKVRDIALSQRIGEVIDFTGADAPDQHLRERTAKVAHRSPCSHWDQEYPTDSGLQEKSFQSKFHRQGILANTNK
jgi:hypothetical protein